MIHIHTIEGGDITITTGGSAPVEPTAPQGKVLYKTSAAGEWLQSDADITLDGFHIGTFNGFNEKFSAVEVIIPSKDAYGNDVKIINNGVFWGNNCLENVTIPNSITTIGDSAFCECGSLMNVTIPDSVISIGYTAFTDSGSITNITIPNSVTSIGARAFAGCSGLTSVTITSNGGNAENVKQKLISAGVSSSITWNMPS